MKEYKIERNGGGHYRVKIRHGGKVFCTWSILKKLDHDGEGDPLLKDRIFTSYQEARIAATEYIDKRALRSSKWTEVLN